MEKNKNYDSCHLEAIENFYYNLLEEDQKSLTLSEVVVSWFTDGHAEKFREKYLTTSLSEVSS